MWARAEATQARMRMRSLNMVVKHRERLDFVRSKISVAVQKKEKPFLVTVIILPFGLLKIGLNREAFWDHFAP